MFSRTQDQRSKRASPGRAAEPLPETPAAVPQPAGTARELDQQEAEAQPEQPDVRPLLTVTGSEAQIEGKFRISESLQVECEVGGELEIGGKLVVGQSGAVRGDVQTVDAVILGVYEGNMVATGKVEIAASGRVVGNLRTDSLVIEYGGFFNGMVKRLGAESERGAQDEPGRAQETVTETLGATPAAEAPDSTAAGNGVSTPPEDVDVASSSATPAREPTGEPVELEHDISRALRREDAGEEAEDPDFLARTKQASGVGG